MALVSSSMFQKAPWWATSGLYEWTARASRSSHHPRAVGTAASHARVDGERMARTPLAHERTIGGSSSAVLALLLILGNACGDENATGPTASIAGRWAGTAALGAARYEVTLTQSGEDVMGSGSFSSPVGSGPFTVTGRVSGSDAGDSSWSLERSGQRPTPGDSRGRTASSDTCSIPRTRTWSSRSSGSRHAAGRGPCRPEPASA